MTYQLHEDVSKLATSAGRLVGTVGHDRAREYLVGRLEALGLEPYRNGGFELPYRMGGQGFTNLIGRIPGTDRQKAPVLLGAHYDTAGPLPGADDNAAAVAIVLAVVEMLKERALERPVLIALFDSEEPPYFHSPAMGSTYFYHHQRQEEIHAAVILDLVGHDLPIPGLEDLLFITGMETDAELPQVLKDCEPEEGIRTIPSLNSYVGDMSDHHVFHQEERPYLFLTCGRWQHYHMPSDTPDKLNYGKMAAIADYLIRLIPRLNDTTLPGPFEGYDATPHELYFMQRHLAPLASAFGLQLRGRQDIDRVTASLMAKFRL